MKAHWFRISLLALLLLAIGVSFEFTKLQDRRIAAYDAQEKSEKVAAAQKLAVDTCIFNAQNELSINYNLLCHDDGSDADSCDKDSSFAINEYYGKYMSVTDPSSSYAKFYSVYQDEKAGCGN